MVVSGLVSLVWEEQDVYGIKPQLLDLRNDFVFRAFFGDKRNNHLLLQFLNAILGNTIRSVTLTDSNVEPAHAADKSSVMDIRVVTNLEEEINIEMQVHGHQAFPERMLLYWAKTYGSQDRVGKSYGELKKAIQIVIADFELLPKSRYHSMFQLIDPIDGTIFSSNLEIHVLELSKLGDKKIGNTSELEKWLLFMKSDREEKEALAVESSALKDALAEIERLSQDPKTVRLAIAREIHLKDRLQREEDAVLRGREEGREEGLEKGLERGLELRDREIVLNMHAENLPAESISKLTKITLEKVKKIIESKVQ